MKTNTRYILSLLLLSGTLLLLGGCRKSVLRESGPGLSPEDTALVDAVLILRCNELQTKASDRETQERQVNDLNLFFVHKSYPSTAAPEVRHYYFSSADMAKHIKLTNIRLGRYTMYAVANAGERLCNDSHDPEYPGTVGDALCPLTEDEIKALIVPYSPSPNKTDNLLMSSVDPDMAVRRSDEGVLPTIAINLERRVARFDFSYELVGPAMGQMKINKIVVQSVPSLVTLFGANDAGSLFQDKNLRIFNNELDNAGQPVDPSPNLYDHIFYLPENIQGTVSGITSEEQRNAQTAPEQASFLYIDGKYKGDQYGVSVYFGDDMNGGNFDVEGNAHYQLHLNLGGPDVNDIRVSSLKFSSDAFSTLIPSLVEQPVTVEIICSNYLNDEIILKCSATGGTNKSFRVRKLDDTGSELAQDEPDISTEPGEVWYSMVRTDNTPGERRIKCRVYFKMGSGKTQVTLMVQTRYGQTTIRNQETEVE